MALKDALRTMGLDSEERLRNPGNHIRDETNVDKPAEATEKQAAVDKTIDLVAMEVVHRMERLEKKRIAAKQMPGQRAATPAIRAILVSVRFQKDWRSARLLEAEGRTGQGSDEIEGSTSKVTGTTCQSSRRTKSRHSGRQDATATAPPPKKTEANIPATAGERKIEQAESTAKKAKAAVPNPPGRPARKLSGNKMPTPPDIPAPPPGLKGQQQRHQLPGHAINAFKTSTFTTKLSATRLTKDNDMIHLSQYLNLQRHKSFLYSSCSSEMWSAKIRHSGSQTRTSTNYTDCQQDQGGKRKRNNWIQWHGGEQTILPGCLELRVNLWRSVRGMTGPHRRQRRGTQEVQKDLGIGPFGGVNWRPYSGSHNY